LKSLVTDLWTANIGNYRINLAATQNRAEGELKSRGVKLTYVPPEELAEQRKRMVAQQDKVARAMRISPEILARINEAIAVTN
jgi:hypothetical protein